MRSLSGFGFRLIVFGYLELLARASLSYLSAFIAKSALIKANFAPGGTVI
jgi:hypothetical protein